MRALAMLAAFTAVIALSACADKPKGSPVAVATPVPAPAAPVAPADRTRQAIDLLTQGQPALAKPLLRTALAEDPGNTVAKRLLSQIDQDPKAILKGKPKAYTVGPGETFSMLAGRFLGDPLLFYALARYNGFEAPGHVLPGHVLQIPRPERAAVVAKPKAAKATPKADGPAPAAAVASRDPARAAQLRAQALDQLNRGAPAKAVSLLQQARELDPGNAAIQRDLSRAQRIQASLASR
jgi:Tfp pilus assembly protein PilF